MYRLGFGFFAVKSCGQQAAQYTDVFCGTCGKIDHGAPFAHGKAVRHLFTERLHLFTILLAMMIVLFIGNGFQIVIAGTERNVLKLAASCSLAQPVLLPFQCTYLLHGKRKHRNVPAFALHALDHGIHLKRCCHVVAAGGIPLQISAIRHEGRGVFIVKRLRLTFVNPVLFRPLVGAEDRHILLPAQLRKTTLQHRLQSAELLAQRSHENISFYAVAVHHH